MSRVVQSLLDGWTLTGDKGERLSVSLSPERPWDVHSALLDAGLIPDPYWRDNELHVDHVHTRAWQLTRDIHIGDTAIALIIDGVDGIATVMLDDQPLAVIDNSFLRTTIALDAEPGLHSLTLHFASASAIANERAAAHPVELPNLDWNSRLGNVHYLRRPACDAGWDWNIALLPIGINGDVKLIDNTSPRLDQWRMNTHFEDDIARVVITLFLTHPGNETHDVECVATLCEQSARTQLQVHPGEHHVTLTLTVPGPARWWPVGHGEQALHRLTLTVAGEVAVINVGLAEHELLSTDTAGDHCFAFRINGRLISMRGANWIPADALPARRTQDTIREQLQSAVDAGMNMIRVWGGGLYESEYFYTLCDQLGLVVWQDFMFSCNHYPATDPEWLASVALEARQQTRRLSRHACISLWCGDNELVGALDWWELTRQHRDRYLANYVRLNHTLEAIAHEELSHLPFHASSPSGGQLDFSDAWHDDSRGDMHVWTVWHESAPFAAYRDIHPHFCSEFGFQSFPSMPLTQTFTEPDDREADTPAMLIHQRNVGGNERIVTTLLRHYQPEREFARTVYLSQLQQALAITTAVEYWRTISPRCAGTLYWQLNDTWPVASWASLEYGGAWKLLHYAARRFYAEIIAVALPCNEQGKINGATESAASHYCVRAVNDSPESRLVQIRISEVRIDSGERTTDTATIVRLEPRIAVGVVTPAKVPDNHIVMIEVQNTEGVVLSRSELLPRPWRDYKLPQPRITIEKHEQGVLLNTDQPAFGVSLDLGGQHVWSDNGFTLLPGESRLLTQVRELTSSRIPSLSDGSRILHL